MFSKFFSKPWKIEFNEIYPLFIFYKQQIHNFVFIISITTFKIKLDISLYHKQNFHHSASRIIIFHNEIENLNIDIY